MVHLEPMRWQNDWPVIGLDPDGDGTGQPVLTHRKPRVPGSVAVAVPATSDEFDHGRPGRQWQWRANPQPQWLAPTPPAGGQLALAAAPVPAEAKNLCLVPSLLLQKIPAEHFTATAKLLFTPQAEGEKAGLVVLGLDYAALMLTRQASGLLLSQTTCLQADKGTAETTAATVALPPGQPLYLRVAVRAGARC
ncbi:hypothetical protein A0257_12555 [Hymenobacter psoromatis]|nr:hypothetical protein A0257_12555 [Hymenobacter psoromatis]